MSVRKPIIKAKKAVKLIRKGASDEALMKRYRLSPKGLESLFTKLVRTKEIDASELEQRSSPSWRAPSSMPMDSADTPPPRKIRIDPSEAVCAIRGGMTDLELMAKFSLSAKGVDKLFTKLLQAGALDMVELERRVMSSQMFQVVELDELPEPVVPKPRIKAAQAVARIRDGMTDTELMKAYAISAKGLQSLFRKLVVAGEIMQAELDARTADATTSLSLELQDSSETTPLKPRINADEAVDCIREGMNDAELMEKHGISAKGLESLFRKLVEAGRIDQAELDRRMVNSQLSHFVDLEELPETSMGKGKVKAAEAIAHIRAGLTDSELMEHYHLSVAGLDGLFRKLVAAGKCSTKELEARRGSQDGADLALGPRWAGPDSLPDEEEEGEFRLRPSGQGSWLGNLCRAHKIYAAAAAGLVVGMISVVATVVYINGLGETLRLFGRGQSKKALTEDERSKNQTRDIVAILEDINKHRFRTADSEDFQDVTALQQCLDLCKKQFASPDPADEGFLVNCRMECAAKHGRAIRAIRKRFYNQQPLD